MSSLQSRRWVALAVGVVVAVGVVGYFSGAWHFHLISMSHIIAFVERARANRLMSVAFYFFYVFGVMALPITMFPIIGGVLFPLWLALPLNVAAATLGAFLSFCVTRFWGAPFVEPMLRKNVKIWDKIAEARGFQTVLLLRLIGIPPFIVSNYALGFSRVSISDFLVATAIGILPWMGIVTFLANSLWSAVLVGGEQGLGKALWHALAPLFFVSCVIAVAMLTAHGMRRRRRHSNL